MSGHRGNFATQLILPNFVARTLAFESATLLSQMPLEIISIHGIETIAS